MHFKEILWKMYLFSHFLYYEPLQCCSLWLNTVHFFPHTLFSREMDKPSTTVYFITQWGQRHGNSHQQHQMSLVPVSFLASLCFSFPLWFLPTFLSHAFFPYIFFTPVLPSFHQVVWKHHNVQYYRNLIYPNCTLHSKPF